MVSRRGRAAFLFAGLILPVLAGCTTARAGSPQPAPSVTSSPAASTAASPEAPAVPAAPPTVATTGSASSPDAARASPAAASPTAASAAGASPAADAPSGGWTTATIETGGGGFPSPTGELTAVVRGGQVCFEARTGGGPCGALAPGDEPVFVVFSPDGRRLLVVAGPDERTRAVYVLDTEDAAVRVIGPAGITDAVAAPARWDLSSVAWSVDGSAAILVPRTDGDTGPVLSADLGTGSVTEAFRLPADLANGRPSIWPTREGTAVVGHVGGDRQTVWWADTAGGVRSIGRFDEAGGSLTLTAADPLGRTVMVCPRRSDGRLGATVGIAVRTGESARILTDSGSCAGAVFSADGQYAAMTATVDAGYTLIIVDLLAARRVLTVPLPAAEPLAPPYLTWFGNTVVISDSSGEWRTSSLVVRLR